MQIHAIATKKYSLKNARGYILCISFPPPLSEESLFFSQVKTVAVGGGGGAGGGRTPFEKFSKFLT